MKRVIDVVREKWSARNEPAAKRGKGAPPPPPPSYPPPPPSREIIDVDALDKKKEEQEEGQDAFLRDFVALDEGEEGQLQTNL